MFNDATVPDLGTGPWGVEKNEADGFFYLTFSGPLGTLAGRTTAQGGPYPLGKTAYKRARQLNAALEAQAAQPEAKRPTPPVAAEPKVTVSKSNPKNPKGSKASKSNPPNPEPAPDAPFVPPDLSGIVFQGTREEWLNAFVFAARPVFKQRDHELPEKIRVSVGFPHNHRGGKVIGQCWHEAASADGTREILVTPLLDDSYRIADVLTHELAHTLFGPEEKHGRDFAKAVTDLGLVGKPTETVAGVGWYEWAVPILKKLGPIPHARLDPTKSGVKKQTTRLLKAQCEDCGFTFRATAKWLNAKELVCPDADCGGPVNVEGA